MAWFQILWGWSLGDDLVEDVAEGEDVDKPALQEWPARDKRSGELLQSGAASNG